MPGPFNSAYAATWARSDQAQSLRDSSPSTQQHRSLQHYNTARQDSQYRMSKADRPQVPSSSLLLD